MSYYLMCPDCGSRAYQDIIRANATSNKLHIKCGVCGQNYSIEEGYDHAKTGTRTTSQPDSFSKK
jgi:transcription elongation factor Elf1